ncbi:arylsulfatase [Pseudomonas fluorescens]|uniref:Arylsulfatase n=1 Tax=Pseudomonas fluorescens TaxID=294 RepID=A0A5E7EV65_PSEFL|nr:arylsulfatase [Pseudomonas fluorescens]VVO30840.1 Arylsulfatase [Pseudomonas fluorescens]
MTRLPGVLTAVLVAALLPLWGVAADTRPNILLIVADDLGYSDLGSFGGEIETPTLDQLAADGLQLTSFYAAPTCSPTRSMLMSGTDNHLVGLGSMAEVLPFSPRLQGQPGYEGYLTPHSHSMAQLLKDGGYATYMVGKWHLGMKDEQGPQVRGFDKSFVLLDGGATHFAPQPGSELRVEKVSYREDGQPAQVPDEFYSSDFYTDKLIGYIESERSNRKPFFAYAAYTAPHWPVQAPDAFIAKYQGRYDLGYAATREARLDNLKKLGLIARNFNPAALLPDAAGARWQELSTEQRKVEARKMEVYAAMVDNLDHNIGRLLDYLKRTGQYDNTLVFVMSDNGAAGEDHSKGYSPNTANTDNRYENIGRRQSNLSYGLRWAEVSATPFRLFKGTTGEGGISVPAIVRLPYDQGRHGVLNVPARVDDLLPTFLELAGLPNPGAFYGSKPKFPITGNSMLPLLTRAAESSVDAQALLVGELFGQAYVRKGQWKLVAAEAPRGLPLLNKPYDWQLFNLAQDRGETMNIAGEHPELVAQLHREWLAYAKRVGVIEPLAR